MSLNLLEELSKMEPPPRPKRLYREAQRRLNSYLTAIHFVDFALQAMPEALLHFAQALLSAVVYSLIGRYPNSPGQVDDPASGANARKDESVGKIESD